MHIANSISHFCHWDIGIIKSILNPIGIYLSKILATPKLKMESDMLSWLIKTANVFPYKQ